MKYVIGLDVGGTTIKGGVVSERGHILSRAEHATNKKNAQGVLMSVMVVINDLRRVGKKIAAIGIGAAGPVDLAAGIIVEAPNLATGKNFPLRQKLHELTHLPVIMDNDATVAALGESWIGAGRGKKVVIMITLGTGIGGGIIINGKIFGGAHGLGGELGHIILDDDGPSCAAGHRGCFEARASGSAMVREGRRRLHRSIKSGKEIDELIRCGNKTAQSIMDQEGQYLGRAITTFIHIFNPDLIIIGGKAARGFPFFRRAMEKEVAARTLSSMRRQVKIVRANLREDAGIIGAARLAFINTH